MISGWTLSARRILFALLVGLGAVPLVAHLIATNVRAATAGAPDYPDLVTIIPPQDFQIVTSGGFKELRYTHHILNAGDGPLEIRPVYDPQTETAQGYQRVYTHDSAGNHTLYSETPVKDIFTWHAVHGHYHFPLARYGVYAVNPDNTVGDPVVLSQKVGFCIAESLQLDPTLPQAASAPGYLDPGCGDPTSMRGIAVGWSDEYNYTDPGQSIDITGIPEGIYWFRGISDPDNNFLESNKANNVTDVKIQIAGNTVTAVNPLASVGSIVIDQTASRDGVGPVSIAGLNTSGPDELLVAFAAAGGPQGQTVSVSGGGLTWNLARRANAQPGTSDVWWQGRRRPFPVPRSRRPRRPVDTPNRSPSSR